MIVLNATTTAILPKTMKTVEWIAEKVDGGRTIGTSNRLTMRILTEGIDAESIAKCCTKIDIVEAEGRTRWSDKQPNMSRMRRCSNLVTSPKRVVGRKVATISLVNLNCEMLNKKTLHTSNIFELFPMILIFEVVVEEMSWARDEVEGSDSMFV